ncbi:MAG TPA: hypothetical protein VFS34_13660, partial [Thermoanaerobaculia bacterium]|nr:hypothetical protein [Thermoanaerobaculia bacterium]
MESSATWPGRLLQFGAAVFMVALAYSTVLAPPALLLHALQALVYLPIIPLARRNRPWLFGAAFMLAAAWNTANLFVTGFIRAGLETLAGIPVAPANPGYVPVVIGACGHFLMIIGLLVAFLRGRPGARSWGGFAAGAVLGILAMAAITPLRMRLHRRPLPLDVPNRVAMESAIKYSGGLTGPARSGFSNLDCSAAHAGHLRGCHHNHQGAVRREDRHPCVYVHIARWRAEGLKQAWAAHRRGAQRGISVLRLRQSINEVVTPTGTDPVSRRAAAENNSR